MKLATAALALLAVTACAKKGDATSADSPQPTVVQKASPSGPPAAPGLSQATADPPDHRKVVRSGTMYITVASYDEARAKLDAIVQQVGGYVDSTQVSRGEQAATNATIVLRFPADKFGDMVPRLHDVGEIHNEVTHADDITDQYVDIQARLASAQALEKRLLELAADHSGTIEQVLTVEKELARVRGEIEGYEGHLRQWNDQIAMSTLTLSLSTKAPEIVASTSFGGRVSHAFHASITALEAFASWLVVAFIALLPWMLLAAPVAIVVKKLKTKTARREASRPGHA